MTFHADSYRSGKKRISMSLRQQDGGSLVEFAIIAPLLFVILFGIIEFGILLYDKAMITNASREGARVGIVYAYDNQGTPGDPDDDTYYFDDAVIVNAVRNYCEEHLISFGGSGLNVEPPARFWNEDGQFVLKVSVAYQFQFLVFSNIVALMGSATIDELLNLRAETVMRMEWQGES